MSIRAVGFIFIALCGVLGSPGARAVESVPAAPSRAQEYPAATAIRLGGDSRQTRLVVDLSRKIPVRAFTLADPYRVVIDLPQVLFKLPSKTGEGGRGLIKAFRFGLVMTGASRMVLDLTGPARIDKTFTLDASDGQPARLVVDLAPVDRETFMRTLALDTRARISTAARVEHTAPPSADPRPVVVIDPGHGGIDNGTRAPSGQMEKTIVLEFAQILRVRLEKSGKYRVLMTRHDDTFVPLADRVQFARANHASLFISIHADALPRREGDAQGASIYTLSDTASDAEAARLAEAENKADVIAGVDLTAEPNDVADILIDLAQRETRTFSVQFARDVAGELKQVARMHKHPLKSAGFRVLKAPDVPSVLVELGYVSNRTDLKHLTSDSWQSRSANSIARAVDAFFLTRLAGAGIGPVSRE